MRTEPLLQTEPKETEDLGFRCRECKHHEIALHGIPGKRAWRKVPKCHAFHCHRKPSENACTSFDPKNQ